MSLDFAYSSTYKNEVINLLYTYKTDGQRVVLQRDLQGNEVLDANWDTLDIKVSAE